MGASYWLFEGETEGLAALNCLNVDRLDKVMAVFRRFIKYAGGNSASDLEYCRSQWLVWDFCVRTNIHKLSCRSYQRFLTNNRFDHHPHMLAGHASWEKYYGSAPRPSAFEANMDAMWRQGAARLAKGFPTMLVK
jgi:hypothetical protein